MNIIFVDFCNLDNFSKTQQFKNKLFKYNIKYDILNNKIIKYIFISINKKYIENQLNKTRFSIYDQLLKMNITSKFKNNVKVNIIFSKLIDDDIKKYILSLFRLNSITSYDEVLVKNNLKVNDFSYIEKYMKKNSIQLDNIKILIIIDNIKDYDNGKMLQYISKYRYIDILNTKNINRLDIKVLKENIEKINNEYGTTIDIIKKRNIQKYNVYLAYSSLNKYNFYQSYILSNKALYIDMTNVDYDYLNENNIMYERYKNEICTLLKRLNINENNFVKAKLGYIFK